MAETPPANNRSCGRLTGLPPVADPSARVLVLGSMPGIRSLQEQRYYAHPRNAFWPVMASILDAIGAPIAGPADRAAYARKLEALEAAGIALWDVIGACRRAGSLDSRIEPASVEVNDIGGLLAGCREMALIAFNGARAEQEFRRHVLPELAPGAQRIERVRLPSTSPAHAAMPLPDKRREWQAALQPVLAGRRA